MLYTKKQFSSVTQDNVTCLLKLFDLCVFLRQRACIEGDLFKSVGCNCSQRMFCVIHSLWWLPPCHPLFFVLAMMYYFATTLPFDEFGGGYHFRLNALSLCMYHVDTYFCWFNNQMDCWYCELITLIIVSNISVIFGIWFFAWNHWCSWLMILF